MVVPTPDALGRLRWALLQSLRLRAFVEDARNHGCDRLFCLDDLGGFGGEPDAIWRLLVDIGVECIAGNDDVVP